VNVTELNSSIFDRYHVPLLWKPFLLFSWPSLCSLFSYSLPVNYLGAWRGVVLRAGKYSKTGVVVRLMGNVWLLGRVFAGFLYVSAYLHRRVLVVAWSLYIKRFRLPSVC
jgi:hypothetical protein